MESESTTKTDARDINDGVCGTCKRVRPAQYHCDDCDIDIEVSKRDRHEKTLKHLKNTGLYDGEVDERADCGWVDGRKKKCSECKRTEDVPERALKPEPFTCEPCGITLSHVSKARHLRSKKHLTAIGEMAVDSKSLHCDKCGYDADDHVDFKRHLNRALHRKGSEAVKTRCDVCDDGKDHTNMTLHKGTKFHLEMLARKEASAAK